MAWIEAHALTMVEEIDLCEEPVLGQKGAECTPRVTFDLLSFDTPGGYSPDPGYAEFPETRNCDY